MTKAFERSVVLACPKTSLRWFGSSTIQDMAIRNIVESDISGKPDAATVTFGLGDTWFEIDLTDEERKELEKNLKEYISKGRKATKKGEKKRLVPETTPEEREEIRKWARENGHEVPEFGRIPKAVMKAHDEAHGIERTL